MNVKELMAQPVIQVSAEDTCQRAAQLMRDQQAGALVITSKEGIVQGIITDRDLVVRCMALGGDPGLRLVGDVSDLHPTTIQPDMDVEEAMELMRGAGVRRLPVVDGQSRAVGMLSMDDVAKDVRRYVDAFATVASQYSRG